MITTLALLDLLLLTVHMKNAQVVTSLQTSFNKSVHKLSTSCVRTACSLFDVTSLEQAVNNLKQA